MKTANIELSKGWGLKVIPYGGVSPMADHKGGSEIAADDENKLFYCWESWLVTVGTLSVTTACNKYIALHD